MFIFSKRLVSIAASTLVLSLVSASANAQIDVLDIGDGGEAEINKTFVSTYTFNQSMILNSILFAASDEGFSTLSYKLNDTEVNLLQSELGSYSSKFRSYTFSNGGLSVNANSVLTVTTRGDLIAADPTYRTYRYDVTSTNLNSNVTYNGMAGNGSSPVTNLTNSNLRVSNPGSNVAPEHGSFALALTGGAALLGICVRRRRNAG